MANLKFPGNYKGPETLVAAASPQDVTAAWADVGDEFDCEGANKCALFAKVDINGSTNVRFRLVGRVVSAGDDYPMMIETAGASSVAVEDHYYELNVDADQNVVLNADIDGVFKLAAWQVQAGAVGAPAGQVDEAYVTTSRV